MPTVRSMYGLRKYNFIIFKNNTEKLITKITGFGSKASYCIGKVYFTPNHD